MRGVTRGAMMAVLLAVQTPAVASEGGGAGALPPPEAFVIPIIDAGRMDGRLNVQLIVLPGPGIAPTAIEGERPRLRAALLATLLDFAQISASPRMPVDCGALSASLDRAVRAAVPGAARVLIIEARTAPR